MRISSIRRLDKSDLAGKGDLPGWLDSLLGSLNGFIDPVVSALQGRLSFSDNLYGSMLKLSMSHNADLKANFKAMNQKFTTRPVGVLVMSTNGNKYTAFNWSVGADGTVTLNIEFKDTTLKAVPCVFWVSGG